MEEANRESGIRDCRRWINLWVVGLVGSMNETHLGWGMCAHLVLPWNQSVCQAPSYTPYPVRRFRKFFGMCLSLFPGGNSDYASNPSWRIFRVRHMYRNIHRKRWPDESYKHKAQHSIIHGFQMMRAVFPEPR